MPTIHTKQSLVDELLNIRRRGWILCDRNPANAGVAGNTLEDLLGIEENNLPLPNAGEWELKTHREGSGTLVTLLHMEPSPRALKIVPYLVENYGWPHQNAGNKYPATEKSFRQTLYGMQRTSRGFCVDIDAQHRRIVINFSYEDIDDCKHAEWKSYLASKGLTSLDPVYTPYWGYDDVFHKAGIKLGNCFYVANEQKNEGCKFFIKYTEIQILSGFRIEKLIEAIRNGHIIIDFDARSGHNHGTKFRIKPDAIPFLYQNVEIL